MISKFRIGSYFALLTILCSHISYSMQQQETGKFSSKSFFNEKLSEELVFKYAVEGKLKEKLDKYFSLILDTQGKFIPQPPQMNTRCFTGYGNVFESPILPGYIIKTTINNSVERILGSVLIRECAQEHNCDLVTSPDKRVYTDPRSGKRYIIAPKIQSTNKPFSLLQIKQLYEVIKRTHYIDVHRPEARGGNIINGEDGRAYIIDTEYRSFQKLHPCIGGVEDLQYLPLEDSAKRFLRSCL